MKYPIASFCLLIFATVFCGCSAFFPNGIAGLSPKSTLPLSARYVHPKGSAADMAQSLGAVDVAEAQAFAAAIGAPREVVGLIPSLPHIGVYLRDDSGKIIPNDYGTGALIGKIGRGFVLTASHLTEENSIFGVSMPDDASHSVCRDFLVYLQFGSRSIPARIIAIDRKLDLSLLEFDPSSLPPGIKAVQLGYGDPRIGENLYMYGYSVGNLGSTTATRYMALDTEDSPYRFAYTNSGPEYGYSGGPLFDEHGNDLGVVVDMTDTGKFGRAVTWEDVDRFLSGAFAGPPFCTDENSKPIPKKK